MAWDHLHGKVSFDIWRVSIGHHLFGTGCLVGMGWALAGFRSAGVAQVGAAATLKASVERWVQQQPATFADADYSTGCWDSNVDLTANLHCLDWPGLLEPFAGFDS